MNTKKKHRIVYADCHDDYEDVMNKVKKAVEPFGLKVSEVPTNSNFGCWVIGTNDLTQEQANQYYMQSTAKIPV